MNNILNRFCTSVPKHLYKYIVPTGIPPVCFFSAMHSVSMKVRWYTGTAVESIGFKDATPAIINVGDHDGGVWSPTQGRPGGRYGSGGGSGRLADVFLQPPNSLGPTSARLRWDVSRLGAKKHNIDGFHIKYRPVLDAERGTLLSISLCSRVIMISDHPRSVVLYNFGRFCLYVCLSVCL